ADQPPRQRGHGDAPSRVPQQVHEVEPGRVVRQRVECIGDDGERAIEVSPGFGTPVWLEEGAPEPGWRGHLRVPQDDGPVVQREAVPEGPEVDHERARRHDGVQPPTRELPSRASHGGGRRAARANSESAARESPRSRAARAMLRYVVGQLAQALFASASSESARWGRPSEYAAIAPARKTPWSRSKIRPASSQDPSARSVSRAQ